MGLNNCHFTMTNKPFVTLLGERGMKFAFFGVTYFLHGPLGRVGRPKPDQVQSFSDANKKSDDYTETGICKIHNFSFLTSYQLSRH